MRIVAQNEFHKSYVLPPSRLQWSARRAEPGIEEVDPPPEIRACNQELLEMTEHYGRRRRAWKVASSAKADPRVGEADNKVDKSFSNFVKRVRMEIEDHGADSPRGKAAQKLLDGPLNVEVHAVTNPAREEQEAILGSILTELEEDFLSEIDVCGLMVSFEVLQTDFQAFVDAMSAAIKTEAAPTTEELRQLAAAIESKKVELINRVNGAYPTTSESDRKNRSLILGPFAIQNDRAAEYFRRNRGAGKLPDVDVDSGADIVEVDDANDGQTAASTEDVKKPTHA